jgi:hypothetical protein
MTTLAALRHPVNRNALARDLLICAALTCLTVAVLA